MLTIKNVIDKLAIPSSILIIALTMAAPSAFPGVKAETIDATAEGTGTQLGQTIGITLEIYDYSTPADTQILNQAFAITGTIGYDIATFMNRQPPLVGIVSSDLEKLTLTRAQKATT